LSKIYEVHDLEYKPKPIKIHIDSYGGAVYQCFGLLGIIKSSKTTIHTLVTGCAMSCGFLIAIAGHKRFAYEKSTYLYHLLRLGVL
jgi:ATP-dependent Clp protease protease subunit